MAACALLCHGRCYSACLSPTEDSEDFIAWRQSTNRCVLLTFATYERMRRIFVRECTQTEIHCSCLPMGMLLGQKYLALCLCRCLCIAIERAKLFYKKWSRFVPMSKNYDDCGRRRDQWKLSSPAETNFLQQRQQLEWFHDVILLASVTTVVPLTSLFLVDSWHHFFLRPRNVEPSVSSSTEQGLSLSRGKNAVRPEVGWSHCRAECGDCEAPTLASPTKTEESTHYVEGTVERWHWHDTTDDENTTFYVRSYVPTLEPQRVRSAVERRDTAIAKLRLLMSNGSTAQY